jgi:hypothetical protein
MTLTGNRGSLKGKTNLNSKANHSLKGKTNLNSKANHSHKLNKANHKA